MPEKTGRTARHRTLVRELERLRKQAGLLTQADAADALGWKRLKYQRLISTETMPLVADVSQILSAFGDPDPTKNLAILDLARHVGERGWWVAYDGLIDGSYVELEDDADRILSFQPQTLPGLLQDGPYASELLRTSRGSDADRKRRLDVRMMRRAVLDREKPPFLDIVLVEEVFDRVMGTVDVMQSQFRFLLEMSERSNVSIRVIEKDRGAYPGQGQGSVVVFEFDSPIDLNTGYVETFAGGYYVEESDKVKACTDAFHNAAAAALNREETRALISAKIT